MLFRSLEELGCEVRAIGTAPDGRFPRPPEPIPENLGDLEGLVAETKADVGFATDPDELSFIGVNTPEALAHAEAVVRWLYGGEDLGTTGR